MIGSDVGDPGRLFIKGVNTDKWNASVAGAYSTEAN
jgi:hypothetical protein